MRINLHFQFVSFCLSVNCVLCLGRLGAPGGNGGAKRLGAPVVLRAQLFGGRAKLTPSPFMCEGLICKDPPKKGPQAVSRSVAILAQACVPASLIFLPPALRRKLGETIPKDRGGQETGQSGKRPGPDVSYSRWGECELARGRPCPWFGRRPNQPSGCRR